MLAVLPCLQAAMWQMTFKAAPSVLPALDHNLRVDEQVSWAMGCKNQPGLLWVLLDHWGGGRAQWAVAISYGSAKWAAASGLFQGSPTKQLSLHQCYPRAAASLGCGFRFRVFLVEAA